MDSWGKPSSISISHAQSLLKIVWNWQRLFHLCPNFEEFQKDLADELKCNKP